MAKPAHTGTISVKPIQRTRTSARLADALSEFIGASQLRQGDRLPTERYLAAAFAVSRFVVREALRTLAADGWVSVDHGRGIFVGERAQQGLPRLPSHSAEQDDQFATAIEARHVFEAGLADLIVERATDDDVRRLELILDEMRRQVQSGEPAFDQDIAFHNQLLRCTRNDDLISIGQSVIINFLRSSVFQHPVRSLTTPERIDLGEHTQILELIKRRDSDGLRRFLKATLDSYLAILPPGTLRRQQPVNRLDAEAHELRRR